MKTLIETVSEFMAARAPAPLTRKTQQAIKRYGRAVCAQCFLVHNQYGEGASTIAILVMGPGHTTQQADAAINAFSLFLVSLWRALLYFALLKKLNKALMFSTWKEM